MEFNAYKITEAFAHEYYQVPKDLSNNPIYAGKINSDAKLLYGLLLSRMNLSRLNNWYDENENIYLIFTRAEAQLSLDLSDKTVTKAFKQLTSVGLIKERKQGLGKPNIIYVGNVKAHINSKSPKGKSHTEKERLTNRR